MYKQFFFKEQFDKLLHVVTVRKYLYWYIVRKDSPFKPLSLFTRFKLFFAGTLVKFIERVVGTTVYIPNKMGEFFAIDFRLQTLLTTFLKNKTIDSWRIASLSPDLPFIRHCSIELSPIISPSGKILRLQNSGGAGNAYTLNNAITIAFAEAIERFSLCRWDVKKLLHGSFEDFKTRGAIDPQKFVTISKTQLRDGNLKRCNITSSQKMHWIPAHSFTDKKCYLIPAQLVYIFFNKEYSDEPVFIHGTTNGAAAGKTFDDAVYGALIEAIERDAFFIFWLNKLTPDILDLESVPSKKIKSLTTEIRKYGLELSIVDITTDIAVPTFAAVLIDYYGDVAVSVSAAAGFDIINVIEKLALSILKFTHSNSEKKSSLIEAMRAKYPSIDTMAERRILWSDKKMIPNIEFLIKGETKNFSDIQNRFKSYGNTKEKLHAISKILKDKNYPCYIVDVTSPEAREANLTVVKAIVPNLVPLYLIEAMKPLGVKRLYETPVRMGRRTSPYNENDLNPTPHPFL